MFKKTGELEKKYKDTYGLTRYLIVGLAKGNKVRSFETSGGQLLVEEDDLKTLLGIKEGC